jgi:hypothetical protein
VTAAGGDKAGHDKVIIFASQKVEVDALTKELKAQGYAAGCLHSSIQQQVRGVTVLLQWCCSGVTVVLQWCYSGVTVVLQWCLNAFCLHISVSAGTHQVYTRL